MKDNATINGSLGLAIITVLAVCCGGCVGEVVDLTADLAARQPDDLALPAREDAALPVAAEDGGSALDLAPPPPAPPGFQAEIQKDIDGRGCSNGGCHGGGAPMHLVPSPVAGADRMQNYKAFSARAMNGAQSLVLSKNLAGSGTSHAGGTSFPSKSDPVYQRWLAWIAGGNSP